MNEDQEIESAATFALNLFEFLEKQELNEIQKLTILFSLFPIYAKKLKMTSSKFKEYLELMLEKYKQMGFE